MSKVFFKACWLVVWLGLGPLGVRAAGQATVNDVLRGMAARAGVIFSGHVESITRNDAGGFVDVRFRIDQPVRGCPKTGAYVLREWAGQWTAKPERYVVGQRLLMLLTARGPSGISAPVDGMDGVIPLLSVGLQPMADKAGVAPADDGSAAPDVAVDLRRLQTRVMRPASIGILAAARIVSPGDERAGAWVGPTTPLLRAGQGSLATQPSLSTVIAILGGSVTTTGGAHVAR